MRSPDRVAEARRGIQSIEVGFDLLDALASSAGPMSLTALAQSASMSPSKAHFYLTSFVRVGLIAQTSSGAYTLGPAAVRLGVAALSQIDVLDHARTAMAQVRDATGLTVFLCVWGSHGPTVIDRALAPTWSSVEIRVGAVLERFSATGRAFLAAYAPAAAEPIVRDVLRTATPGSPWHGMSLTRARGLLADVRRDGYAVGFATVAPGSGLRGLSAAIVDPSGNPVAALTVNGDAATIDTSPDGPIVRALLDATRGR